LIVDQPRRVEVWTEASDLMALAARIARAYGVPCVSASGWSGPVMPREAARRWAIDERPVELIYLGDLDHPDGIEIAERNIVTAEQVEAWAILSEAGRTSHRNDITVPVVAQAEAIPPARLPAQQWRALTAGGKQRLGFPADGIGARSRPRRASSSRTRSARAPRFAGRTGRARGRRRARGSGVVDGRRRPLAVLLQLVPKLVEAGDHHPLRLLLDLAENGEQSCPLLAPRSRLSSSGFRQRSL
jgi:hypothetical protein